MSYASQTGRARTSASSPQAHAICQRCGFRVNHCDLQWQMQWAGAGLQNLRLLVCHECLDIPQDQLRALVLPPDPVPVLYALPEPFVSDEEGNTPPYGQPVGLDQNAVMPLSGTTRYGVELAVLSITATGSTTISVTCSEAHGLATDDQVSVEGLTRSSATGFFSVTVTSATAFTYQTFAAVTAGNLTTPNTRIVTALVGLPYGFTTIPQVGP